ncbi:hypothetical protein M2368_003538 [Arthrobacter sp. JUb119]|nr:hypothetical protein [Arthrobacter sp. JUb119]TDU22596.1 hypothetical protein EDF61_109126 [Arthrobacter sp. JUb115]
MRVRVLSAFRNYIRTIEDKQYASSCHKIVALKKRGHLLTLQGHAATQGLRSAQILAKPGIPKRWPRKGIYLVGERIPLEPGWRPADSGGRQPHKGHATTQTRAPGLELAPAEHRSQTCSPVSGNAIQRIRTGNINQPGPSANRTQAANRAEDLLQCHPGRWAASSSWAAAGPLARTKCPRQTPSRETPEHVNGERNHPREN